MRNELVMKSLIWSTVTVILLAVSPPAFAHCDTMNGPVVKAAQAALKSPNINLVLIWVPRENEQEVTHAFQQTVAVRKLNRTARELADKYFFETVVRIHRAGEGEPYTGLKPVGTEIEPVIVLADKALETGSLDSLLNAVPENARAELRNRFGDAVAKKRFNPNNVSAGRQYVAAYVSLLHFLEELHETKSG